MCKMTTLIRLEGILQNKETEKCVSYENPEAEEIVLVSPSQAFPLKIWSIGEEPNPVYIFHLERGIQRVLDFSDDNTLFFTTHVGERFPENQKFTLEIDRGVETEIIYKFKQDGNRTKYLTAVKVEDGVGRLAMRERGTNAEEIKFQQFVLLQTPDVTSASACAPVLAQQQQPKGFLAKMRRYIGR